MNGQLKIAVSGDRDRFLRNCLRENIVLKEIEEKDISCLTLYCRTEDIFKIKHICRKSSCRAKILEKKGAAFLLKRIVKRPIIPFGLIAVCFTLWVLSGFVWSISIDGCEKTAERELREALYAAGLKTGVRVKSIRAQEIKNDVMLRCPTLAYLTVNIQGSHAYVTVYERTPKPAMTEDTPCDVVSGLTGVISAVRVRRGESRVTVGQTVSKGDIIASGVMEDKVGGVHLVNASAEIDVRTWYTQRSLLLKDTREYRTTGRARKVRSLILFGKRVKLYLVESPEYKWYYKNEEIRRLQLGGSIELPIAFAVETYSECEIAETKVTQEQAESILKERMLEDFARSRPEAEIIKTEFYAIDTGGAFEGVLRVECLETTGIQTEMTSEYGTDN